MVGRLVESGAMAGTSAAPSATPSSGAASSTTPMPAVAQPKLEVRDLSISYGGKPQ